MAASPWRAAALLAGVVSAEVKAGAVKQGLVLGTCALCALIAAMELWALASDGPEPEDPAELLWGLPAVGFVLAASGMVRRRRLPVALTLAALSFSAALLWVVLIVMFSG